MAITNKSRLETVPPKEEAVSLLDTRWRWSAARRLLMISRLSWMAFCEANMGSMATTLDFELLPVIVREEEAETLDSLMAGNCSSPESAK